MWAPAVPAVEQLQPDSSDEERSKFILEKYSRGRYRRVHALAYSQPLMDQVSQLLMRMMRMMSMRMRMMMMMMVCVCFRGFVRWFVEKI